MGTSSCCSCRCLNIIEDPKDGKVITFENNNISQQKKKEISFSNANVNLNQNTGLINQYQNNDLKDFDFPIINKEIIPEVEQKIKEMTGFETYKAKEVNLNKYKHKIEGTYIQYNRGCILYALLNNGYIDEKDIPDSMKYYKDHSHKEEKNNAENLLKRTMSILDLAQLWMNIGGESAYLEIDFEEAKLRIYSFLNEYFSDTGPQSDEEKKSFMEKVFAMTWQTKDYFELLGNLKQNIKNTLFSEIPRIKDNPSIKNALDKNIIKERDIIKYGRHCFIFDKITEENSVKKYVFQDSLAYFRESSKDKNYNNCDFSKKGYISANEDSIFLNLKDTKQLEIGIVDIIIN